MKSEEIKAQSISFIREKKFWIGGGIVLLLVVTGIFSSMSLRRSDSSLITRQSVKSDLSSDKNYLLCIREQLDCVYSNKEKMEEACGSVNLCDDRY